MRNRTDLYLNMTLLIVLLGMALLTTACGSTDAGNAGAAAQGQTKINANIVGPVCRGQALPETQAYSQATGVHSLAVMELQRDERYMFGFINPDVYRLPDGWESSSIEALELVVCVDSQEEELVETCDYTLVDGGETVTLNRYAMRVTFRLLEAQTGREIATDTLVGFPNECRETAEFVEGTTGSSMIGNVYDELEDWLRPYVEIP